MSYVSQKVGDGSASKQKGAKLKKKDKQKINQLLNPEKQIADPDDDIFGDAGTDYIPQPRKKKSTKSVKFDDSNNTYFNSKDEMNDIPVPGSGANLKKSERNVQQSNQQQPQQQKQQQNDKEGTGGDIDAMMGMGDAYTECFPEYHSYGGMYVDSDEEDMAQMDTKTKGKSRFDFSTEEEWQRYKLNKEATPKAAFQFGQKMGDGRVNQKNLEGQNYKKQNQKMRTELSKIEGIFKDKGYGHGSAFQEGANGENLVRKRKRLE
eukprot:TRINITY_DN29788_c0_g2_i11.p2 TRINITY_DN29788_c0_g2~~TRINITY_DN29788_c0_g2_i11.p2  ORF type:complete len:263 (-),score=67.12 TRINITY_DN29788_c0_g2_i11:230-1018(-)